MVIKHAVQALVHTQLSHVTYSLNYTIQHVYDCANCFRHVNLHDFLPRRSHENMTENM